MLNKSALLLLATTVQKGDFAITVGTWSYITGYAEADTFSGQSRQCGAISAMPYWNVAGYSWRLTSLNVSTYNGALVTGDMYAGYRKVTSAPSTLSVRLSCNGGAATTSHPGSWGVWMYYTSDVFGLRNAVGKTLQVFCNPKPDGYV